MNKHDFDYEARSATSTIGSIIFQPTDFTKLDHVSKVSALFIQQHMFDALMLSGQFEHTGDWDWVCSIRYAAPDGSIHSTWNPDMEEGSDYCDGFILPYEDAQPGDYLDGFSRWTKITAEVETPDGTLKELTIPIDSIQSLQFIRL